MPLRTVAVIAGYVVYKLFGDHVAAGAFVGIGSMLLMWQIIDRSTMWRRQRLGLLQAGTTLLALGLIAIGAFMRAR